VQDDVELVLAVDKLAADFDVIAFRRLHAEVGTDTTVDGYATVRNQLVAMAPRTDAGCREKTV
jgi:hypothetical protein